MDPAANVELLEIAYLFRELIACENRFGSSRIQPDLGSNVRQHFIRPGGSDVAAMRGRGTRDCYSDVAKGAVAAESIKPGAPR